MKKILFLFFGSLFIHTLQAAESELDQLFTNELSELQNSEEAQLFANDAAQTPPLSQINEINLTPAESSFQKPIAIRPKFFLEAQAAYYYPTSSKFRSVYSGSGIYGAELDVHAWKGLYAWGNGSVFAQNGHSTGISYRTHILFVPIGIGLKYLFDVGSITKLYVAAGALPTYLKIHDESPYVVQKINKWGCGGNAKVGALFKINQSFFIDLFSSYSYIKIANHDTNNGEVIPNTIDISGVSFGGGISYRF